MANEGYRVLVLISTPKLAQSAVALFGKEGVPIQYQLSAVGTATGEILNALGLANTPKSVLVGMMPAPFAPEMLRRLRKSLKLYMPGNGIAFTTALTGATNHARRMLDTVGAHTQFRTGAQNAETLSSVADAANRPEAGRDSMSNSETKYALIAAVVDRGFSDEVMAAAKGAGARGGTVISSRRTTGAQAAQLWGLSLQEEKDAVLILAPAEQKTEMMQAISKRCGIATEARGIVLSMPIDGVVGIGEEES